MDDAVTQRSSRTFSPPQRADRDNRVHLAGLHAALAEGKAVSRSDHFRVPTDGKAALPTPAQYAPSFDEFYRTHFRSVVAICYALTGSCWGAEDVAQEAFLAAHRKWKRVQQYDRADLWIRRVAANLAVSRVRRQIAEAKALLRFASLRSSASERLPGEDDSFWRALSVLPARQAQALTLRYVDDRPLADIAEVLGCAEGTVKSHLARGRAAVADRLGLTLSKET